MKSNLKNLKGIIHNKTNQEEKNILSNLYETMNDYLKYINENKEHLENEETKKELYHIVPHLETLNIKLSRKQLTDLEDISNFIEKNLLIRED